jgi:hypothetical protein
MTRPLVTGADCPIARLATPQNSAAAAAPVFTARLESRFPCTPVHLES